MSKKSKMPKQHGRVGNRRHRERKRRYLVVSGGAVTEKQYFNALETLYDVVIDYRQKNLSPPQLAKLACELKDTDRGEDPESSYVKVWVVVDVDCFHDHRDAEKACSAREGMELIISNPCFEVWLIDRQRVCPQSHTQTAMVEELAVREGVTEGNRGKYICKEILDDEHIAKAVANARRHNRDDTKAKARKDLTPKREQDYAPWTDMPLVIEELKKDF